jgi:hypothetical protein
MHVTDSDTVVLLVKAANSARIKAGKKIQSNPPKIVESVFFFRVIRIIIVVVVEK